MRDVYWYANYIVSKGGCTESVRWLARQPDPETAWDLCPNLSWRFWAVAVAAKEVADLNRLAVVGAEVIRTALRKTGTDPGLRTECTPVLDQITMMALGHVPPTGYSEQRLLGLSDRAFEAVHQLIHRFATLINHPSLFFPGDGSTWHLRRWQWVPDGVQNTPDLHALFKQFYPALPAV